MGGPGMVSGSTGAVIGVTGSVGKTTTRQMIHHRPGQQAAWHVQSEELQQPHRSALSMLQMEPGDDYVVLEMGASGPGEIARLAALCRPTIGVITHVGDAHLGGFGTRQGIAEAKAELLDALPADGCAILGEDPWLEASAGSVGSANDHGRTWNRLRANCQRSGLGPGNTFVYCPQCQFRGACLGTAPPDSSHGSSRGGAGTGMHPGRNSGSP